MRTSSMLGALLSSVMAVKLLTGSKERFLYRMGAVVIDEDALSSVCPSGAALAAKVVPRIAPAPGLLSTTNRHPVTSLIFSEYRRE